MNPRRVIFPAALFLSASFALSVHAQTSTSGSAAAAPTQAVQTPSQPQPAAKKVWTNDDVSSLQANAPISTVGPSGSAASKTGNKPGAKNNTAKSYQDQIDRLQAQIPPIDSQIAQLRAAIDGKPTGDARESSRPRSVKIDDWSVEMQRLQKKRDGIESRISALEDQARHHGAVDKVSP